MKKFSALLIVFCFLLLILVVNKADAMPTHWIVGFVDDAIDSEPANDHIIMIYYPENRNDNETDIIGPSGNSGTDNRYMIDCEMLDTPCAVGDIISVEVLNSGDNYISDQVNISVTGAGYDIAPDLTLESYVIVEINFTTNSVNWGDGSINSGDIRAVLNLYTGTVENGSWTPQSSPLVLENIGNVPVKLELISNKNASSFVGSEAGSGEENEDFEWKVLNTTVSCNETYDDTDFTNVALSYKEVCPNFYYNESNDNVTIFFKVIIPSDTSKSGGQAVMVTARGTQLT